MKCYGNIKLQANVSKYDLNISKTHYMAWHRGNMKYIKDIKIRYSLFLVFIIDDREICQACKFLRVVLNEKLA